MNNKKARKKRQAQSFGPPKSAHHLGTSRALPGCGQLSGVGPGWRLTGHKPRSTLTDFQLESRGVSLRKPSFHFRNLACPLFCMALSKPENWQTLARGGGKASADGGGFAQTQGLYTRCIQGEETPILKAAVPARSQGLGSINQSAGVIFRQEPEPSKQCKASRQLWAWRRAVNSEALHFPSPGGVGGGVP